MRSIQRLPEPQVLINNKATWLQNFLLSGKNRPDSSKYAHSTIKNDLNSMSSHKCFYCESNLKEKTKEVDHHIEVSVNKDLAYDWENLYLSCDNCNNKIPHDVISINDVLDPCRSSDIEIQEHLTFEKELIKPKNNSEKGLKTIKKYRLDTEQLDNRRRRELLNFFELLYKIVSNMNQENRNKFTDQEVNTINSFAATYSPYSLEPV